MNNKDREWTVLIIGGASGTGKSTLAYEVAKFYGINVLEVDDIGQALKASTNKEIFPNLHYWSNGINWKDIGIEGNKNWLINVSREIFPSLKAVVKRHYFHFLLLLFFSGFLRKPTSAICAGIYPKFAPKNSLEIQKKAIKIKYIQIYP
jgi:hypothetical protein